MDVSAPNGRTGRTRGMLVRGAPIMVAGAAVCGCVAAGLLDPERHTIMPPCPFRAVTGLYCPGCGMTRGLHRLVRGDLFTAAQYNLLLVALVPVAAYFWLQWAASTYGWFGGRLKPLDIGRTGWALVIVLGVTWAVLRNTGLPVFSALALGRT